MWIDANPTTSKQGLKWDPTGLPCLGTTSAMSAGSTSTLWFRKQQEQNFLIIPTQNWLFLSVYRTFLDPIWFGELNFNSYHIEYWDTYMEY